MPNFCQNRACQNYLHPLLVLNLPHHLRTVCQSGERPQKGAWKSGREVAFQRLLLSSLDVKAKTKAQPEITLPPCFSHPLAEGSGGEGTILSPSGPVLHPQVFGDATLRGIWDPQRLVFSGCDILKTLLVSRLSVELLEFTR